MLYLSGYLSDFNPIELAFVKMKVLLRSASARSFPSLRNAIRRSLTLFALDECRAYLAAAGYDFQGEHGERDGPLAVGPRSNPSEAP